jgi:membrane protease YdiL (CAAX protease family)
LVDLVTPVRAGPHGFSTLWRGHLFLFDKVQSRPTFGPDVGNSLLWTVVGLEALRLVLRFLALPFPPLWLAVPVLLGLALLSVRVIAGLPWSEIGFREWSAWNGTEKSFFIQVLLIANVLFPVIFAAQLRRVFGEPSAITTVWSVFVPYLFFGFYQEVLYRGMLQTELVRRWGLIIGILVSNLLYTFGPLHYYYFSSRPSFAVPMFAAIFAMGLVFATIFRRSGNLWIVAVMHGIGNAYIVVSLRSMQ